MNGYAIMKSRELHEPRLPPGLRVRYDCGKWDACANAVRFVDDWATHSWAQTREGVTVPKTEFPGGIYPDSHPWGVPDFATPVRFDGDESATWVRTSCLDVIDSVEVIESGQQVMML